MPSSTLVFKNMNIPAAPMGELSPLADIGCDNYIKAPISFDETLTESEREYIGKGMIPTLLPYRIQNNYTRDREMKALPVAVLENDCLRATFLTGLGGRLYSLYDKKEKRELLYKNPVFQPANLALRNAWFSGGIEWNVGIKGHNPLTCSPLFARSVTASDGEVMLEMYEYERIRGVVYSMLFRLEGDLLLVRVNIENRKKTPVNMYWWSNIAVTQNKDTRVIEPADSAIKTLYLDGSYTLTATPYPMADGKDLSYPAHHKNAIDYFYRIPDADRKWIASVEPDGKGFFELSDSVLKGRKLFLWGTEKGGAHWNEWLSDGSADYIEIQAGIMRTQMEHFPMQANSRITFTEAFGPLSIPSADAVSESYGDAVRAANEALSSYYSVLESVDFSVAFRGSLASLGSGFGAVESLVRGEPISELVDFPEVKDDSSELLSLVKYGKLPKHDPLLAPAAFVADEAYKPYLLASAPSWYRSYLLGVLSYATGDRASARRFYEESLSISESPWAYRDLAMLARNYDGDGERALSLMERAFRLLPIDRNLAVDLAETLISLGRHDRWLFIYENELDVKLKQGRLRMLAAHAAAEAHRPEAAISYLTGDFIMPDFKEGEFSVFAIWLKAHAQLMTEKGGDLPTEEEILEKYPLPYELDFRMH